MRRRIHRGPPGGLAECQTCRSVDKHSEDIREPLRRGNCLLVDTPLVLKVLEPIWQTKTETATRVRGRIESILTGRPFAAIGLARIPHAGRDTWIICCPNDPKCNASNIILHCRTRMPLRSFKRCEPNPATRKGFGLPHPDRDPYQRNDWRSMERDRSVGWHLTIPAERMKAGKEHRVPLSKAALELLHEARTEHAASDDYVFVGQKAGRPFKYGVPPTVETDEPRRHHCAWISLYLSGLGRGSHASRTGNRRSRARAYDQGQVRGGVRSR